MSSFTVPDDKTADVTVSYVDGKGKPAKVDGAPVWTSSDPAQLAVTPAADGMTATIEQPAGGSNDSAIQVTIEADVDLGAGVKPLQTIFDVTYVAGEAVAGNVGLTINP